MHHGATRTGIVALALLVASCGGAATGSDAGTDGAAEGGGGTDGGTDAPAPDGPCADDDDADGHRALACGGDDCDDRDPSRYPGNLEVCDPAGIDEDCDPTTLGPDHDGDGQPSILCCDRQADASLLCGDDCDDARATIGPTAIEACNGLDDDCDGSVDEGVVSSTFYPDCDGDLFGGMDTIAAQVMGCVMPTTPSAACGGHGGWSTLANDCDDTRASVSPAAAEICDGIDDDCDSEIDERVPGYFEDCDRDGYGDVHATVVCALPALPPDACLSGGWSPTSDDCDDAAPGVHPRATETCNGVDDDCDDVIDASPADAWCGGPRSTTSVCTPSGCSSTCASGFVDCDGTPDCDDVTTDARHCGTCAHACGAPTCAGGSCTEDFIGLATAGLSTCAVRASGRSTCWGYDDSGQFGLGSPHPLAPLPGIDSGFPSAVAMSGSTTGEVLYCVLTADHHVVCAGTNLQGECGVGYASGNVFAPATVPGISDATQVSVGVHTCALHSGGTISCWGEATQGQCGDGSAVTTPRLVPVLVSGISDATQVVVGRTSSCAVHADHRVSCWGANGRGQLGTGDYTDHDAPVPVVGLTDAVRLGAGHSHVCAVRTGGTLSCWGMNFTGTLGDGTTTDRLVPTPIPGITDAVDVSAAEDFTCVLHASGHVSCWGGNALGTLGDGTRTARLSPVDVVGLDDAVELRTALAHVCVRHASNVVACWGGNAFGMLDDGTTTDRLTPVDILTR